MENIKCTIINEKKVMFKNSRFIMDNRMHGEISTVDKPILKTLLE